MSLCSSTLRSASLGIAVALAVAVAVAFSGCGYNRTVPPTDGGIADSASAAAKTMPAPSKTASGPGAQ